MAEWRVYGAYGTSKKFRTKKAAQKYAKGDPQSRVGVKTKRTKKRRKMRNPKAVRKTAHRKAKAYFKKHPDALKEIMRLFPRGGR